MWVVIIIKAIIDITIAILHVDFRSFRSNILHNHFSKVIFGSREWYTWSYRHWNLPSSRMRARFSVPVASLVLCVDEWIKR